MASKNEQFTDRLVMSIKNTDLKYPAFAKKHNIGYSTLMRYLNKKSIGKVPEWDQLVQLSEALNKSIDWLLTGKEHQSSCFVNCDDMVKRLCSKLVEMKNTNVDSFIAIKTLVDILHNNLTTHPTGKDKK